MKKSPFFCTMENHTEIITAAITTLIGIIIRAIEKRRMKKQAEKDGSNKEKI